MRRVAGWIQFAWGPIFCTESDRGIGLGTTKRLISAVNRIQLRCRMGCEVLRPARATDRYMAERCMAERGAIFPASLFLFLSSVFLFPAQPLLSQVAPRPEAHHDWDFGVWVAGESGEEITNSFSEAQILTAGVFAGRILTDEIGHGWRRGRFEYGFDLIPVFRQFRPQSLYGAGFEPVILRWNSSLHAKRLAPYIELAGGGVRTNVNLPAGNTSNFNFTARGGGGFQIWRNDRQSVEVGCRWSHVSNANLGVKNPEFNGIQVNVGYHWFR